MEKIYPFTILDVAGILDLKVRRRQPTNMDVDCPFCNHKKGKMNINLVKNVFRCNYCETSGGMIDLYAKLHRINQKQAFAEICEILHCGKKAPEYQTFAAKQKNMVPELEQVERADLETRDQTYRMLLSQLILTASHKQNLLERGLRIDEIVKYQYRSELLQIVRTAQKGLYVGKYEVLSGEASRKRRLSGYYFSAEGCKAAFNNRPLCG